MSLESSTARLYMSRDNMEDAAWVQCERSHVQNTLSRSPAEMSGIRVSTQTSDICMCQTDLKSGGVRFKGGVKSRWLHMWLRLCDWQQSLAHRAKLSSGPSSGAGAGKYGYSPVERSASEPHMLRVKNETLLLDKYSKRTVAVLKQLRSVPVSLVVSRL